MESIVSKEEYLHNPCGLLSIPYWKAKITPVPNSIEILHQNRFHNQYKEFQRYFRLIHHLDKIGPIPAQVQPLEITEDLVSLMNICFKSEYIVLNLKDLFDMQKHSTYRKDLWIGIEADDRLIGCAIAEYDLECREGSIEWICVLPEYQRRGYGSKLI
ncbi:MAG: GNAT family N-acetyltransferase, partial [Anaeroplasmataceae bacterium]|nr:GNAT family N-acetyltransferase [Anaeroplasmataceae bacterium]